MCIEDKCQQKTYKIQIIIYIMSKANKGDDVTFEARHLAFIIAMHQNTTFLEYCDNTEWDTDDIFR